MHGLSFIRERLVISIFVFCLLVVIGLYSLLQHQQYDYLYRGNILNHLLNKIRFISEPATKESYLSAYAVCKSQVSQSLVCDRLKEGGIDVFNASNLVTWKGSRLNEWGNKLSPYWQARGAAFLLGSSFACSGQWNTDSWIKFLPASTTPLSSKSCVKAYPELFRRMCSDCGPDCNMIYAHKCVGAWNHIRDQIQQNTRSALEHWAVINNRTIPFFNASEMVLYDRCSGETILHHPEYGPIGFSAFQYVPKTVTILYQVYANARTTSICNAIRQAHITYLSHIRPDIVVIPLPGDIWQDFTKLVYASKVLVIYAGSSFALWSTLANVGHVWIPPLYGGMTPDVGSNYHWINTSILYPSIGEKLKLGNSGNKTDNEKIIEWLRNR